MLETGERTPPPRVEVRYEHAPDGWITAQCEATSQGRDQAEALDNMLGAIDGLAHQRTRAELLARRNLGRVVESLLALLHH
jgi:hypothetical protein